MINVTIDYYFKLQQHTPKNSMESLIQSELTVGGLKLNKIAMKSCNDILITNLYSLDVISKALDYTEKMKNKGEKLTLQRHLEKTNIKKFQFPYFHSLVYFSSVLGPNTAVYFI